MINYTLYNISIGRSPYISVHLSSFQAHDTAEVLYEIDVSAMGTGHSLEVNMNY